MMKKFALALVAVAAMILGVGGVANAYPLGGQSITISPSTVSPGGSVTVTANCTPGESVTITLESSSVTIPCETDDTRPTNAGIATGIVNAPTTVGSFDGTVTGTVSGPLGSFTVTVQTSGTTPTSGLPTTGGDGTSTMTMIAVGLLVVGLGLFVVATVRRRQTPVAA